MSIGEMVFGANWVEQWRNNYRDFPFSGYENMSEFDAADCDDVDAFSWDSTPEGREVWSPRHSEIIAEDEDEDEDEDYDDNVSPLF